MFSSLYNNTFGEHAKLEKVTEKYPYFSAAHFFLLQQTDAGAAGYESIAAKTALHFANPFLLQQQLHAAPENIVTHEIAAEQTHQPDAISSTQIEEEIAAENNFDRRVEVTETAAEETVNATEEETIAAEITSKEPAAGLTGTPEEAATVTTDKKDEQPPLLFEPLHTTDYFASQGIKLSEVIQPNDKIGRQLKSFTEWLKTMKKVHPDAAKDKNDGNIDPSVQNLAEKSNKEEEVLTEAMAVVYLQQGKTNKAKEIYEKLSLLNPSKSAYFAAKLSEIQ